MIARKDITQQTAEWHEIKYGRIGGSTSKQLLIDSEALLDELISARLEPFELEDDGFESKDMARGNELEPLARLELGKYLNLEFEEFGWLQCEEWDIIGISPDGLTSDRKAACEIKCPARKKHTSNLRGGVIPSEYLPQCVHNFTVNPDLEICYFASFRPESKHPLFVRSITLDSIVDLGTKSKPNARTVREWVKIAKDKAMVITNKIESEIARLDF